MFCRSGSFVELLSSGKKLPLVLGYAVDPVFEVQVALKLINFQDLRDTANINNGCHNVTQSFLRLFFNIPEPITN